MDALGNELETIERALVVYPPRAMAKAGAIVSLDHMGGVAVHRGLLRGEEAKALREQERQAWGAGTGSERFRPGAPAPACAKKRTLSNEGCA